MAAADNIRSARRAASRRRQRGLSFIGLVLTVALIVGVVTVAMKAVPILIEYQAVLKASRKAARESTTVAEVRAAFDRSAAIDDITSLSGRDLEVSKENDHVVVAFSYTREIPLGGPVYLTFKFSERTH
ncbi:DUF4845 domain-containing protein [Xylophilus sp.]|uniref:DUF4845 domain-containing protein n=1 Tax=Xylophilus sp. TaxID=2653893 RepID=UPI0013B9CA9B|nr:DUF4845 domain-containing protein [Xylophilus sp.]KAF1045813.1 MAG: hypothetical protein GAK38_02800 [Xylophilus sp.]